MSHTESSNFSRRLKREAVSKTYNIRLDRDAETVLNNLKHHLQGHEAQRADIPSSSVVLRRALTVYGQACLPLTGQSLIEERRALIASTYLPAKRRSSRPA
jgi:hypothetical protein